MTEAAQGALIFVVLVILFIAAVGLSASRHPMSTCRRCSGTGRKRSWLLSSRWRPCPYCSGGVVNRRP
ncbi:hypothetical protein AB0O28_18650 [Microbispora sp. NPDC088329]|uniref:hypothetical protein n=1 Tax=Microbispora sp. NPDC088329 TaxID=3154869 RepID=UPI00342161BB